MDRFNQAEHYENNSKIQKEIGLDLIKDLSPELGNQVLDLGCGTGFLTKTLADLVGPEGKVIGVDPDGERLKIAQEKYSASNIQYLEGSAECISGNFMCNIVFNNFVLHWCKDKERALNQVKEKLKQGGKFGFTCLNFDFAKKFSPIVSPKLAAIIAAKIHYIEWDKFSQIIANNQFKVLETRCFTAIGKHKGIPALVKMFKMHFGVEECDETYLNTDAVRECYGQGEICLPLKMISVILCKI